MVCFQSAVQWRQWRLKLVRWRETGCCLPPRRQQQAAAAAARRPSTGGSSPLSSSICREESSGDRPPRPAQSVPVQPSQSQSVPVSAEPLRCFALTPEPRETTWHFTAASGYFVPFAHTLLLNLCLHTRRASGKRGSPTLHSLKDTHTVPSHTAGLCEWVWGGVCHDEDFKRAHFSLGWTTAVKLVWGCMIQKRLFRDRQ